MAEIPTDIDSGSTVQPFAAARPSRPGVPWAVLGAVAAGGAVGALARYGLASAIRSHATGFPWGILVVNVSGCLLMGVLMVLVSDLWSGRRLLRPFLGTGLLGGYTTFSTYVVDAQHLMIAGAVGTALAYLVATVLSALAAVYVGMTAAHVLVDRVRRAHTHPAGPSEEA